MKKIYITVAWLICLVLLAIIFKIVESESVPSNVSAIKTMEISKVTCDNKDPFDVKKMNIIKTWDFTNNIEAIKLMLNKSVIGDLEPIYYKIEDNSYSKYYLKITYNDNSVEEWLLDLDNKFEKDGVGENKANKGRCVLIAKEYVKRIGKLFE